jgi:hypothetical protein
MGMCVGKFLEIQSICESLVWYMENAQRKIKLYARMKLLLNMYTRETHFAFATVQKGKRILAQEAANWKKGK